MYSNPLIEEKLSKYTDEELSLAIEKTFNVICIDKDLYEVYDRKLPMHTASIVRSNGEIITCFINKCLLKIITKSSYFKNKVANYTIK